MPRGQLLAVARPLRGRLSRDGAGQSHETVRFAVHASHAIYVGGSGLADLENGRSPLAPLWTAFSEMLGPLMVTLFRPTVAADPTRYGSGIARARRLRVRSLRP